MYSFYEIFPDRGDLELFEGEAGNFFYGREVDFLGESGVDF